MKEYILDIINRQNWQSLEDKIYNLESQDRQFLSILSVYDKIEFLEILKAYFLNSFVSFQLSWYWEDWWEEFSRFLLKFYDLYKNNKILFWSNLLKSSKNNKRLYNLKINIIKRNLVLLDYLDVEFYKNMELLYNKILDFYWWKYLKTVAFSIKIFWYVCRIKYWFRLFPYTIPIPLDSRIRKFYHKYFWLWSDKEILNYFNKLSMEINIPPLHIDSIIWINQ